MKTEEAAKAKSEALRIKTEVKGAKEKAKELFEKHFIIIARIFTDKGIDDLNKAAKQCAIFTAHEQASNVPMYKGELNPEWRYLYQVKEEIEKI